VTNTVTGPIPSCHLRLVCDLYNPTFCTWTEHAVGSTDCDFQSAQQINKLF